MVLSAGCCGLWGGQSVVEVQLKRSVANLSFVIISWDSKTPFYVRHQNLFHPQPLLDVFLLQGVSALSSPV